MSCFGYLGAWFRRLFLLGWHCGCQAMLGRGRKNTCLPPGPTCRVPVSRHVDPCGCRFPHIPLITQIQRPCLDSLQMQQEYPWKHRSQTSGCSWEGAESAQERSHLGGAHQEVRLALDLEGKEVNKVFSCPPVRGPIQSQLLSPCSFFWSQTTYLMAAIIPQVQVSRLLACSQATPLP